MIMLGCGCLKIIENYKYTSLFTMLFSDYARMQVSGDNNALTYCTRLLNDGAKMQVSGNYNALAYFAKLFNDFDRFQVSGNDKGTSLLHNFIQ